MTQPAAPTRVRYGVVLFGVTLAVITYIDRICIMKTADDIHADLKLTDPQRGWILGIFALTYGLFEVPWGSMGDRIGARKILMRIVTCWSLFTAATGWAWNFGSLLATRSLFGVGEAGCFSNITKTFTTWLTDRDRVRAQGLLWLAARWAGAFTPLLVVFVLRHMTWRYAFNLFGAVGIVWAALFYRWYRDHPAEHPGVNAAELALLPAQAATAARKNPVPWGAILTQPRVWILAVQYFFLAYGAYFYISWLPKYVRVIYGVEGYLGAMLDGMPLFFMGLGSLFCGFFLARFTRWIGNPGRARRLAAIAGFVGSASFLFLSTRIPSAVPAMVVMGLAAFSNDLIMPTSWAAAMDLGGRNAATVSAIMNTGGSLGGFLCGVVAPLIKDWSGGNWKAVLYVS
ncbi:MAG TPA: MFS transporter, partial [Planctomycetota bacterium]|nr:MFS transporter [Planctomycetota bacterium]